MADDPLSDPDEPGRLTRLEMRAAESERVIEDLSEQIAAQWRAIDRIERQVARLADRFLSLEEALPPPPAAKPPHW